MRAVAFVDVGRPRTSNADLEDRADGPTPTSPSRSSTGTRSSSRCHCEPRSSVQLRALERSVVIFLVGHRGHPAGVVTIALRAPVMLGLRMDPMTRSGLRATRSRTSSSRRSNSLWATGIWTVDDPPRHCIGPTVRLPRGPFAGHGLVAIGRAAAARLTPEAARGDPPPPVLVPGWTGKDTRAVRRGPGAVLPERVPDSRGAHECLEVEVVAPDATLVEIAVGFVVGSGGEHTVRRSPLSGVPPRQGTERR